MTAPVLELRGVSFSYPDSPRPALDGVSLSVDPGELVVVAGASGSGKSTLLRVANGLVPHFHGGTFAGEASVAGRPTRQHGPGELAGDVGTLFQDPETQVVMGTVRAELALPLQNRGLAPPEVARAVEETALALGIGHLLERATAELSGGELQRVALGAALVGRPALVVLDEPTSQLDPVSGDELLGLLRRLNEDHDTAVLLAEHRLERCLAWADRVVALDQGRVACDAAPAEFLCWALAQAPELATPGAALLAQVGIPPCPGVKAARAALRRRGLSAPAGEEPPPEHRRTPAGHVLRFDHVWHELRDGPAILRSLSLQIAAGERVALMGRNGAGKSTLLRHAAGLMQPTRGKVRRTGAIRLLLQNPGDYLLADRVAREAAPGALKRVGLDPGEFGERHPRDLSGGEKQRLALAIVLKGEEGVPPALVCLDEPTRGMDRGLKLQLAELLRRLPCAALVATHDPEFAAALAERVVLLADGGVIADGTTAEILAHGTYFATETARILGGAGGALTPSQGALLLRRRPAAEVPA